MVSVRSKSEKSMSLQSGKKRNRLAKSKALKKRFACQTSPNIVFSDEKLFTIEQVVNHQNDRIWCKEISSSNKDQFDATRRQKPASVMVWAAVTATGRSPLVFFDQGVKINAEVYRQSVLREGLLPWAQHHFQSSQWTYQHDSAPSHKAKTAVQWLKEMYQNLPVLSSDRRVRPI